MEKILSLPAGELYILPAGKKFHIYTCPYHGAFLSVEDDNPPESVPCPHVKGDFEYSTGPMDITDYEHCELESKRQETR